MTIGQLREQIAQIGVGFDAVHLAGTDEAGEAGPVPAAVVVVVTFPRPDEIDFACLLGGKQCFHRRKAISCLARPL